MKALKLFFFAILQFVILAPLGWAQGPGTTNLLEGPNAGSDSVVLAASNSWTVTSNDSWLHLSEANQSGTNSANVIFSFDANPAATRTGTLTIAGQTLTVTQAGSTYVAATNVAMLVSSGLNQPHGVAVDGLGNVYIADTFNDAIKEWVASGNTVITLVSSGLNRPTGVAVDGACNVYIADSANSAIKEWIAASNDVVTLVSSGLIDTYGLAVDGAGNVYIANSVSFGAGSAIKELPRAFVDTTPKTEPASGGSDSLPVVVPATANLTGPFAPASDSLWLTITGVTNGVVSFALTANSSATNRTANITVLGQAIPITQMAATYSLGTTNLLEGPTAGSDSVVLAANSSWTATVNDSWLHLSAANQSGTGSAIVIFSFDANSGATRTGTLTIAGQTLTVTQAGSTYVAVTNVTTLVSSELSSPYGVAVDGLGNVYIADNGNNAIKEWVAASNTVSTLVSSGLDGPSSVAVDSSGNVYIADTYNSVIMELMSPSNTVVTLLSSGLNHPTGVAVDGVGNVYIADNGNFAVKEWLAASNTVITLVSSGLSSPVVWRWTAWAMSTSPTWETTRSRNGWQPATPSSRWCLRDYRCQLAWR